MAETKVKVKKPIFKKWWFWVLVVILLIIIIPKGGNSSSSTPTSKPASGQTSTAATKDNKKYSYDKFMKVSMGMTYEQVKSILGAGTEDSSSGSGDTKAVSYTWKNDDGGNISVMLQGDKVTNKAQADLQSMDAKVTLDKYNKIKNGMTYDQAKTILGEGQLTSETEIMGTKDQIYDWINFDGANMNVTFENGKVDSKAQFELK